MWFFVGFPIPRKNSYPMEKTPQIFIQDFLEEKSRKFRDLGFEIPENPISKPSLILFRINREIAQLIYCSRD